MKRIHLSALLAVSIVFASALPATAAPFVFPLDNQDGFPHEGPPTVTAASWIVYDEMSDRVLAEWDADARRPMASTTKIMTVLLAMENGNPDDDVLISKNVASTIGQEIGLVAGETVTLGALMRGGLVHSGNDAATAIAEHIGGSVARFVEMMNERAAELGMDDTHYMNPHGLDTPGHYSSARDMLTLARTAMSIPAFANIVSSSMLVFPDAPDGSPRTFDSTNSLLNSYEGLIGVKTGQTPDAEHCFVGAAERNGRRIYVVVLHSVGRDSHFSDAVKLFNWAFEDLQMGGTLTAGIPYEPMAARVAPPPLTVEAGAQVFVHTASQGLIGSWSLQPEEAASEPPVIEVTRHPDPAPQSLLSALTYWLGLVTGNG